MAAWATPPLRALPRTLGSWPAGRRTGSQLLAGGMLGLLPLLVILAMTRMDAVRGSHTQDPVDRTYRVLRGVDLLLAGVTNAETGPRGLLLTAQDDPAPFLSAQKAVAADIDTITTLTADDVVQQQRIARLRSLVDEEFAEMRGTISLRRPRSGPPASFSPVLQNNDTDVLGRIRSLTGAVRAQEEALVGVRQAEAAAATHTTRTTLFLAGLMGLLIAVAAASVGFIAGPLRRTVRRRPAPGEGRPDQRRPDSRDDAEDMCTVPETAPDGPAGAERERDGDLRSRTTVVDGPAATSGTPSSSPEEPATPASAVSAEIADLIKMIGSITQQTSLVALDTRVDDARARTGRRPAAATGRAQVAQVAQASSAAAVTASGPFHGAADFFTRPTDCLDRLVGARGVPETVAYGAGGAGFRTATPAGTRTIGRVQAIVYAAARSRAHGPTAALWHAVELRRPVAEADRPCEVAVCGSLVRVSTEQPWPVTARGVCPACATLAH